MSLRKPETFAPAFTCQLDPLRRDFLFPAPPRALLRTKKAITAKTTVVARPANRRFRLCTAGSVEEERANGTRAAGVKTTASSKTRVTTTSLPSPAEKPSRLSRHAL